MSALLVRKRSFSSSSTIATRTQTARPLEGIFEFFEMPPLAEKLCAVKQFYLYFGIGRFERPNKSAHLNSNFEDSPHLVTVDHPSSIGSLAGGQHFAQTSNSFQVVLWTKTGDGSGKRVGVIRPVDSRHWGHWEPNCRAPITSQVATDVFPCQTRQSVVDNLHSPKWSETSSYLCLRPLSIRSVT